MNEKESEKIVSYWLNLSEEDLKVMDALHELLYYQHSLFMGHLSLEKLLKGYFVFVKGKHPPYTHDLTRLAVESNLQLSSEQISLLDAVTQFNIEARYPDIKLSFHKKATREFSAVYIRKIKEFYSWLKSKILL